MCTATSTTTTTTTNNNNNKPKGMNGEFVNSSPRSSTQYTVSSEKQQEATI
jgi:hypothetical protein